MGLKLHKIDDAMAFMFESRLAMDSIRFQKISDMPLPSDGYVPVATSVAGDGSLLFLCVEPACANAVTGIDASTSGIFRRMSSRFG